MDSVASDFIGCCYSTSILIVVVVVFFQNLFHLQRLKCLWFLLVFFVVNRFGPQSFVAAWKWLACKEWSLVERLEPGGLVTSAESKPKKEIKRQCQLSATWSTSLHFFTPSPSWPRQTSEPAWVKRKILSTKSSTSWKAGISCRTLIAALDILCEHDQEFPNGTYSTPIRNSDLIQHLFTILI